jgi:predicted nuclease of predicted toxin-antitoxin system
MRFFLDQDVPAQVAPMLRARRHDVVTAYEFHVSADGDGDISVAAKRFKGAVVTHDREFTDHRKKVTIGQHIWLSCLQRDAVEVFGKHLDEVVEHCKYQPDVVIEVRVESVKIFPPRWPSKSETGTS